MKEPQGVKRGTKGAWARCWFMEQPEEQLYLSHMCEKKKKKENRVIPKVTGFVLFCFVFFFLASAYLNFVHLQQIRTMGEEVSPDL